MSSNRESGAVSAGPHSWLSQPPGSLMQDLGAEWLRQILPNLFGYHLVQVGTYAEQHEVLSVSRILHRVRVQIGADRATMPAGDIGMACEPTSLPFASDSIDVVILPHVLEFATDPHQVLREVERVLVGEGHVIIIGINPLGWFGVWQLLRAWRSALPWTGRFLTVTRLRDWLQLLGFELRQREYFFYRPPLRSEALLDRLEIIEDLGASLWPAMAGGYVLVARKRVESLIPMRVQWSLRRRLATAGAAGPSARSVMGGKTAS